MTNEQIIYTVAIGSGALGVIAYIAFILVPAWGAYSRDLAAASPRRS